MKENQGILFAKIDSSRNEIKGLDLEDVFPNFLLFSGYNFINKEKETKD